MRSSGEERRTAMRASNAMGLGQSSRAKDRSGGRCRKGTSICANKRRHKRGAHPNSAGGRRACGVFSPSSFDGV
ncbi:hypothetical protein K438DRAFT_1832816 [Mycena galopus ATCC 62051]|nr:hypothetical protein K438DRAFT_1866849 [Mycena galopus ATCC 62051]KAF8189570.1 hypothetical protein K438DRAFT_1832816 [Mycena galopus ATCC 62051]